MKTDQVIRIFDFFKFTQFSNRAVLAYVITVDFQIQVSPGGYYIFHKLKFNLLNY